MGRKRKSESTEGGTSDFGSGAGMEEEDLDLIKTLRAKRKAELEELEKEGEENA